MPSLKSTQAGIVVCVKRSIPRLASEEKDLLPGGVKERPEQVRKQFGKPRTTRKNKRLGAQVITPERRQRLEVAAAGRGSDSVEAVIDAQLDRLLHECVDRTTCEDDTAVGFQHSSRDRSKLKLGKPSLEILTGEQLDVYTEPLQRQCRRVKQWILVAPKKQDPSFDKERELCLVEQRLPLVKGLEGPSRINFFAAITHPDDTRFPARARSRITGTEGVDQGD